MSTLFNNNNSEGGYRLHCMEVYNWGTFNAKVFKLQTNGQTSLLTGANGSGKTTLIDALLTLLVPSNKRFYNQSSGAEAKKERDESSYFWGHHGKTYSELDERSKTEQLRTKAENPYSVLLACFKNAGTLHTISLVQVRWFSSGTIKKVFIVAPYALNINEHFGAGHFDMKGDWKKKLQKLFPKTELYDSFKEYGARFSDLFGLKEKALSLFNQTVGIKVLGDLTQFIRQQMLEVPDAEDQFIGLYNHYTDLLISHKAIQKDEKQLELLTPVINNKLLLTQLGTEIELLNFIQEQVPFYLQKIEYDLLDDHIIAIEKEMLIIQKEQEVIAAGIIQTEDEQKQLITQKANLNIDAQVQLLSKDKNAEGKERDIKKGYFDDYIKLAEKLGLQTLINESSFRENLLQVSVVDISLKEEYETLTHQRFQYKNDKENLNSKVDAVQHNISSLLKRKNRIPDELINARKRLLDLLETGEEELPFVGELLKVKETSLHWEDAIEKLLHSFSMQLIVPEKYNKQVNHFVYSNNLKTKLVYQRIDKGQNEILRSLVENEFLINKLEIKDAGGYTNWLNYQLTNRFNYWCTDDLDTFYGSQKAVTSNGLIRNANRHEKDDRPNRSSKLNYTLGWDNKETIQLLQQEKFRLQQESDELFKKLQEIGPRIKTLDDKKPIITLFQDIKLFNSINWQLHAKKYETLNRQIEDLKQSSDKYKTISAQLLKVDLELTEKRKTKDETIKRYSKWEQEYEQKQNRKNFIQYNELTDNGITAIQNFCFIEKLNSVNLNSLEKLSKHNYELSGTLKQKQNSINNKLSQLQMATNTLINSFINPNEKILKEFPDWSGDLMNVSSSLASLDELEDLFNLIRNQRLVEHKRRFSDYMDKSMLDALTNYRTWLINEEDRIREIIEELNIPLKKITFNKNPDTYLQLECRTVKEQEIKLFREQLSGAIPNTLAFATNKDEAYRNEVFKNIKELITELQKEEVWRKKVTDVRNWLSFGAREYSITEGKAGQYHDNTASYSGGQKAQFTYAILGAAIAHQFGIFQTGKQYKSLRFITVDEAFSKLDPEKSQFLMEFCAQLNLQILVVTPLDKINIAEPYISAVHFVEIKNKKESIVYNLTMDEYTERKEEFKQLAQNTE